MTGDTGPRQPGPYETEQEARAAVAAIYDAAWQTPMADGCRAMLDAACAAAGVTLGAFDRRIIHWLSAWECECTAVVAGLILRARRAGEAAAGLHEVLTPAGVAVFRDLLADAVALREPDPGNCCCQDEPCADHSADVAKVQAYLRLSRAVGVELVPQAGYAGESYPPEVPS